MRPKIFIVFLLFFVFVGETIANDTLYIKVHFLYGSKPKREFRASETRWFGGILGGHVGIEIDSDKILDFVPEGSFHLFSNDKHRNSKFAVHNLKSFWAIFDGKYDSVKKATIIIPITRAQKHKLDSIAKAYSTETPYDYAFFGMRCGAAAYDILGQIGVLEKCPYSKMCIKIFYPKKLRKRLFKKAAENRWRILRHEGSRRRIWEND